MKLERFGKIRGHRIFKNFTWPITLEEFGRFNLVYGWNGTGKTTLSGLLKSLQTGTAVLEGDVDFVLDGTTVAGKDLSQVGLPQVRVFSRDTVARSVFESTGGALGQLGEGHDDASALGEAPEVLRDVLALIKECDERHFARMKLAIAPPV